MRTHCVRHSASYVLSRCMLHHGLHTPHACIYRMVVRKSRHIHLALTCAKDTSTTRKSCKAADRPRQHGQQMCNYYGYQKGVFHLNL